MSKSRNFIYTSLKHNDERGFLKNFRMGISLIFLKVTDEFGPARNKREKNYLRVLTMK